jgi:hypothetical protein
VVDAGRVLEGRGREEDSGHGKGGEGTVLSG